MKVSDFMRIVTAGVLAAAFILPGCTSQTPDEPSKPTQVSVSKPDAGQAAPTEPALPAEPKSAEPAVQQADGGTQQDKSPVDPAATVVSKPTLQKPPPIRRPNIPSGMDKYANFKGKRIGLIHMANMLGETDPCG
ncbi:MAG: hypothetical protein HUU55_13650 [Myxococcales bacterium]|nr:hypothetical protein [Myxococcales bacterium]